MAKCPQVLRERIAQAPNERIHLLLRVSEAGETQRAAIENAGLVVQHQTTLVPCFAVCGPGAALTGLLQETWLISVEEDAQVQTF